MSEALDLGRITEARFADAFADAAIITAKAAAWVLGLDVKTLGALTDTDAIRAVHRGKLRAYTERDLRAFLTEDTECRSTSRPKAASINSTSSKTVVAFTARQGLKPAARPKP